MVNMIETTTSIFVPESYPVSVEIFPLKFDERTTSWLDIDKECNEMRMLHIYF